jgi:hypothetical protein
VVAASPDARPRGTGEGQEDLTPPGRRGTARRAIDATEPIIRRSRQGKRLPTGGPEATIPNYYPASNGKRTERVRSAVATQVEPHCWPGRKGTPGKVSVL